MRIGCLQFSPTVGNVDDNLNTADELLDESQLENLDLLVLPELAFTGYDFKSLREIFPYLEPTGCGLSACWAKSTALKYDCNVIVGYPEKVDVSDKWPADPEYYNSAVVVNNDGETIANYQKTHLYSTDETWALEGRDGFFKGFIPGLGRMAMGICMDLNPYRFEAPWGDFEFARHAISCGARLIVLSMAWLTQEDPKEFTKTPQEPDIETLMYWIARLEPIVRLELDQEIIVVFANRNGTEGSSTYVGTSAVVGIKNGEVLVYGILGRGEQNLLVVDTDNVPYAKLVHPGPPETNVATSDASHTKMSSPSGPPMYSQASSCGLDDNLPTESSNEDSFRNYSSRPPSNYGDEVFFNSISINHSFNHESEDFDAQMLADHIPIVHQVATTSTPIDSFREVEASETDTQPHPQNIPESHSIHIEVDDGYQWPSNDALVENWMSRIEQKSDLELEPELELELEWQGQTNDDYRYSLRSEIVVQSVYLNAAEDLNDDNDPNSIKNMVRKVEAYLQGPTPAAMMKNEISPLTESPIGDRQTKTRTTKPRKDFQNSRYDVPKPGESNSPIEKTGWEKHDDISRAHSAQGQRSDIFHQAADLSAREIQITAIPRAASIPIVMDPSVGRGSRATASGPYCRGHEKELADLKFPVLQPASMKRIQQSSTIDQNQILRRGEGREECDTIECSTPFSLDKYDAESPHCYSNRGRQRTTSRQNIHQSSKITTPIEQGLQDMVGPDDMDRSKFKRMEAYPSVNCPLHGSRSRSRTAKHGAMPQSQSHRRTPAGGPKRADSHETREARVGLREKSTPKLQNGPWGREGMMERKMTKSAQVGGDRNVFRNDGMSENLRVTELTSRLNFKDGPKTPVAMVLINPKARSKQRDRSNRYRETYEAVDANSEKAVRARS